MAVGIRDLFSVKLGLISAKTFLTVIVSSLCLGTSRR